MSDPNPASNGPPNELRLEPGHPAAPYRDPRSPQAQFLIEVEALRAPLLRYCSRMLGSALDGEDVVQDTLATTFFRLDTLDRGKPLRPLLFRIAHNRCIDLLRRRRFQVEGDEQVLERSTEEGTADGCFNARDDAARALELLVVLLPPRERSCVVLKDVLELSLEETAEVTGTSVGAVKAALHRGRGKLLELREGSGQTLPRVQARSDPAAVALLQQYVDRFNRRDWHALAELLQEDVRLDVVGILEDGTREVILDRYTGNYSRLDGAWRLALGTVDGELVLLCLRQERAGAEERVAWPVRIRIEGGKVAQVRDYVLQQPLTAARQIDLDARETHCEANRGTQDLANSS